MAFFFCCYTQSMAWGKQPSTHPKNNKGVRAKGRKAERKSKWDFFGSLPAIWQPRSLATFQEFGKPNVAIWLKYGLPFTQRTAQIPSLSQAKLFFTPVLWAVNPICWQEWFWPESWSATKLSKTPSKNILWNTEFLTNSTFLLQKGKFKPVPSCIVSWRANKGLL